MQRLRRVLMVTVLLICAFVLSAPVTAQPDQEAHEFALQALEDLWELESYHFTLVSDTLTSFTSSSGTTEETSNQLSLEGDVQGADYQLSVSRTSPDEPESPSLNIEYVEADGKSFINLQTEDTPYAELIDAAPGWWERDALLEQLENPSAAYFLVGIEPETLLPSNLTLTETLVTSVTEVSDETEAIAGVETRVFDLEIDPIPYLLSQTPGTVEDRLELVFQSGELLEASELNFTFRLWIGADDGMIYRIVSTSSTFFPYREFSADGTPDFDIATEAHSEMNISRHGETFEIIAPDQSELNS